MGNLTVNSQSIVILMVLTNGYHAEWTINSVSVVLILLQTKEPLMVTVLYLRDSQMVKVD